MNRDQKAAAIAEIAQHIREAEAVFAVDYRGISVPQAADLRTRLREADATFRIVKNTLTERAADEADAAQLKTLLVGPTALTFVRGDAALAAKALATFGRETQLLQFKGGLLDGDALDAEQIQAISRLPARDVLYGQLVGMVAAPITGLARGLNALLSGVAVALGQVLEKKEKGELPAGEAPAAAASAEPAAEAPAETATEPAGEASASADAETPGESEAGGTQAETPDQDAEAPTQQPAAPDAPAEGAPDTPDQTNEEADASA
jgi:large subunit ribosomal protein L10